MQPGFCFQFIVVYFLITGTDSVLEKKEKVLSLYKHSRKWNNIGTVSNIILLQVQVIKRNLKNKAKNKNKKT